VISVGSIQRFCHDARRDRVSVATIVLDIRRQLLARIVCVVHEFDEFAFRRRFWQPYDSIYLLFDLLQILKRMGHRWQIVTGPHRVAGDVGILHVNCTCVGDAYLSLAQQFRVAINFRVADISKRVISGAVLKRGEAWPGPVIIKSDFNYMGYPEAEHNAMATRRGRSLPHPGIVALADYTILPSLEDVPDSIWDDNHKVVERFLPELDEQGYALRTWVFAGTRERCTRHVSPDPIVKGANVVSHTACEVPMLLRNERTRLGFDFGKFDFVVHEGQPVPLDANRTPSSSPALREFLQAGMLNLAQGLDELIVSGARSSATRWPRR